MVAAPVGGWTLLQSGTDASPRVEVRAVGAPAGVALALPRGAALDTLTGDSGRGWIAAGTRPRPSGSGSELLLFAGDRDGGRALPVPRGRTGRERAAPTPVLSHGALSGLLWLEGNDHGSYAVRAASWDGARWSAPELVAPRAPGSQLALASAELADGTWLAVWSRFDGNDDEIVWSVRRAGGWSEPRTIGDDNDVPDITPTLIATAHGALVAWNHYDGNDYRVQIASFDGRSFAPATTLGGPGWVAPQLTAQGNGATLSAQQALPSHWVFTAVDALGSPAGRVASLPAEPSRGRPWVADATDAGVTVVWSGDGGVASLTWRPLP